MRGPLRQSSVIENLVGRDFLPRGAGLVTRCPIILQLQPLDAAADGDAPADGFAQFAHSGERRFAVGEVAREIERQTRALAGERKGITSKPVVLQLHMPNVLPLTLVDMPGMTRVAIADQPPDIEKRIRACVLDYIRKDNAIILAVHAANQDLATSDALQLAHSVDRDGQRTVGVLTKIDIMDKGTSPIDILSGARYPLKLGCARRAHAAAQRR